MAKTPTYPQCKIERSPETYTKNCAGCTKYHKQRAYDNKPGKYLEEAIPYRPLKFTPWNMKAWESVV